MGLLSNTRLMGNNKWIRVLAKHQSKLFWFFYMTSLIWFGCLAHPNFNHVAYLSENALSPGLVYPEMTQESGHLVHQYLQELSKEYETKSSTPYDWIVSKMQQIGLDTHVHNYTMKIPFSKDKLYKGKNVYGILRAPRSSSTEGIIFSAPYRLPSSTDTNIIASVPFLLAFAKFARSKNYWAKDLIFLVTEHEQLGLHAFLDAYFNMASDNRVSNTYLNSGYLPSKAGALQTAINLEIQDLEIDYINVKIEGLNGQLPNLDLFNVVQRIATREGIPSGYKQTSSKKRNLSSNLLYHKLKENFKNMLQMLFSQVTGVPNGNHGLFHRYRIEALTLEGCTKSTIKKKASTYRPNVSLPLLKTIEGISRSLNNLLERFHQSYFFYILIQNDRFISIGDYMPCLILLTVPLIIGALLIWLESVGSLNTGILSNKIETFDEEEEKIENNISENGNPKLYNDSNTTMTLIYLVHAYGLGFLAQEINIIDFMIMKFQNFGFTTPTSIAFTLCIWMFIFFIMPFLFKLSPKALKWLYLSCLISLGTTLIILSILNFALAYLVGVISVPLCIIIGQKNCNYHVIRHAFELVYCLLLNPLILVYGLVTVLTFLQFPEYNTLHIMEKGIYSTKDAIAFTLMDSLIFDNWLYMILTLTLMPIWCGLWALVIAPHPKFNEVSIIKKNN